MQKKGAKSLQMIFGLFMLLIISLVVLAMFFKFIRKGGSSMTEQQTNYAQEARKEAAVQECEKLCNEIQGSDGIIEFCRTQFKVDWNEDGVIEGHADKGKWWFCEKKIPCFVLYPDCKNRYDGARCREELAKYRKDIYQIQFLNDIDGENPAEIEDPDLEVNGKDVLAAIKDGCDLPYTGSNPDDSIGDGHYPTYFNWKERFCFNGTADQVLEDDFECPQLSDFD